MIDRQTLKGSPGPECVNPSLKRLLEESMDIFRGRDSVVTADRHQLAAGGSDFNNASELMQVSFGVEKPQV